jgi:hypothetical protein
MMYFGVVLPPDGSPRSRWGRVLNPGFDSNTRELKTAIGISVVVTLGFVAGVFTQNWLWRGAVGVVIVFVYVPMGVRAIRQLRRST